MTKQQKQARKRSSINKNAGSSKNVQQIKQQEVTKTRKNYFGICSCVVVLCLACIFVLPWKKPNLEGDGDSTQQDIGQKGTQPSVAVPAKSDASLHNGFGSELHKNFKPNILNRLQIKSTNVAGMMVKVKQLQHSHKYTAVRAYVLENFFSAYECDALSSAHDSHVSETSRINPLLCFDSVKTFRQNLKEVGLKIQVSGADFLHGTSCINESLSLLVKKHGMKWSYSTSFYPGESKFSLILQERIKQATGLMPENGGKFQITSYPQNVDDGSKMTGDVDADISVQNVPSKTKGYKNHTDCLVGQMEKRDRYATILVYLKDVAEGGETVFPQLGLSVTPKKGLALVWNSMTEKGECDPSSIHNAAQVVKGRKYILQRWYYYQNFPSLGKRMPEPSLPSRKANQPRVSCDQYEFGSCRWYDEWNYDHITEYVQNQHDYV